MIQYNLLSPYKDLTHFCTTREGGVSVGNYASMNLSPFSGDEPAHVAENKRRLCETLGLSPARLVIPFQTHGAEVREISETYFQLPEAEQAAYLHGVDAMVSNTPGVCLGITTADCVPLLFFDPVQKAVGAAHAGWRGTVASIARNTMEAMTQLYGSRPEDMLVTIGPSISAAVYEVGTEVLEQFREAGFDLADMHEMRNGSLFLDLWAANRQVLTRAGILPEHIETANICTYTHHERFFSARRLGIKSGRLLSGVMVNP